MASLLTGKDLSPCRHSLRVLRVERNDQRLVVTAESVALAVCPACQTPSTSRHSHYERTMKDLPYQGLPVTIQLRLGRWRCRNRDCAQAIFVQRLEVVVAPRARRTARP